MTEQAAEVSVGRFIKRSLIGGIVVLLPLTLVIAFFRWLFRWVGELIQPFTDALRQVWDLPDFIGHAIVIGIIVMLCFTAGYVVSTRIGGWLWAQVDSMVGERIPGYKALKDLVAQVFGHGGGALRGEVCLVKVMGRDIDITVTGMVTARHADGRYTVFVPCGPNPTTGFIYHVAAELVELRPDIRVDAMMKTVIACGVGATDVLKARGGASAG